MEKVTTAFRTLDKKDQQSFVKTYGKRFTGLQFNKFYERFKRYVTNGKEEEFIARDFHREGKADSYNYRGLVESMLYRIEPNFWYFRADTKEALREMQRPALEKANHVIDLFFQVQKREAKAAMRREIEAEGEGLVSLEQLREMFWMFEINIFANKMLSIRARGNVNFEKKTCGFTYTKWQNMPLEKSGFYDPKAFKAAVAPLLEAMIKRQQEAIENLKQVAQFTQEMETL